MSSLVSEFIINPVLRQARRFSEISRTTLTGDADSSSDHPDAISESSLPEHPLPPLTSDEAPTTIDAAMPPQESPRSRPQSASTQETHVDETTTAPIAIESAEAHDHLGFPLSPKRTRGIPEDDGMHTLRVKIQAINSQDISQSEKAKLMHETLTEKYRATRAHCHVKSNSGSSELLGHTWELTSSSPSSQPLEALKFWHNQVHESVEPEKFVLNDNDIKPTFVPMKQHKYQGSEDPSASPDTQYPMAQPLGCQHYQRNVKLQCFTCKKWYTCRFCHDANEDHNLIRPETRNMLCMICATPQRASDTCINCGEIAASYYCNICKLWENRSTKPIYHCNDCGICRRGMGLGKDFFHCKTCRACISTSIESSHKCIERSTDCDCPICGEYLFTSPRPVVFMSCGHSIHKKCYEQHMSTSYKCPICNKSLVNMESQFRNLDVAIQGQPMPPEFRDTKAVILCNDCSGRSTVSYHWLGLKCGICRSYNTVELQILGGDHRGIHHAITERAEEPINTNTTELPTAEPTLRSPPAGTLPQPINAVANRRRHSSHAVEPAELDYRTPDRVARSASPLNLGFESIMAQLSHESDSDSGNDFLGLWGGGAQNDNASSVDDSGSEMSDEMSEPEEEEEDDENDIVLFGHR